VDVPESKPIACTLTGTRYGERLDSIAELAREGLRGWRRNDLLLELRYRAAVGDRVRELARKEAECCPFLALQVSEGDGEVCLTITAPEAARDLVDSLFAQFVPALPGGPAG